MLVHQNTLQYAWDYGNDDGGGGVVTKTLRYISIEWYLIFKVSIEIIKTQTRGI